MASEKADAILPSLVSPKTAREMMGVSIPEFQELVRTREIKAVKVDGEVMIATGSMIERALRNYGTARAS